MKLFIDRADLKPEYENVNCSRTKFQYFADEVQTAIIAVGRATFREYDGSNYNAIYPLITEKCSCAPCQNKSMPASTLN